MQYRGATYTSPYTCATHRHRSTHPCITRDLATLVDANPHTYGAYACSNARRHAARTKAYANAKRPHGYADANTRRSRTARQSSGNSQDRNKLFHGIHCAQMRPTLQTHQLGFKLWPRFFTIDSC